MKIGVRLSRRFDDAGEYLADARAFDAAGVDALWLTDAGYDPWLLLAGIAAVTGRTRLVVPVAAMDSLAASEALHGRVETLQRLSRGRLFLTVTDHDEHLRGVDTIVEIARRVSCGVILQASDARYAKLAAEQASGLVVLDESADAFRSILDASSRHRRDSAIPFEAWATMKMPSDRDAWRASRAEYEAVGATGVIVPVDPRLLDLLRNGEEEDDRSDLGLAQG